MITLDEADLDALGADLRSTAAKFADMKRQVEQEPESEDGICVWHGVIAGVVVLLCVAAVLVLAGWM